VYVPPPTKPRVPNGGKGSIPLDHPLLEGKKAHERLMIIRGNPDLMNQQRPPCKFGSKCYQTNQEHHKQFSHLGDDDYPVAMRLHGYGLKPEFLTVRHCFLWSDPFNSGFIDDYRLLRELFYALGSPLQEGESERVYAQLDSDGNGEVGFPEFADWCLQNLSAKIGRELPLGIDDSLDTHVLIPEHWEYRPGVNTNDDERHELYSVNTEEYFFGELFQVNFHDAYGFLEDRVIRLSRADVAIRDSIVQDSERRAWKTCTC
jgi:hypothetical protein